MKKNYLYISICLLILSACTREKLLEKPEPTVAVQNYNGGTIVQEAGKNVLVDVSAQAIAGIRSFEVTINGTVTDRIESNDQLNLTYTLDYTVPAGSTEGTTTRIVFRLTDNDNRIVTSIPVVIQVGKPYQLDEVTVSGFTYSRIRGRVNENLILTADKRWLIDSIVSVEENAIFTVEPGTTVYFRTYTNNNQYSLLSINRGSRLMANGTRENPIVFTSDRVLTNNAAPGDWGGILLHGFAPNNQADVVVEDGFRYGGNNPADNSGTLRFVRIEYTGKNDFHALHLFSVGAGTVVEYVEVYRSFNIAFRIKGGRVSLKYIAAIRHGGYALWAENGWQGNGQFWVFQTDIPATLIPVNYWNQARSIELRNDLTFFKKTPRTTFRISNVTLIGNGNEGGNNSGTRRGIRIRRGAIGILQNSIVTQFPSDGVRVEDLDFDELGNTMIMDNTRSFGNFANWEQEAKSFFFESNNFNLSETPVPGISRQSFTGVSPVAYNPNVLGSFFSSAPFIGAVDPANDWTTGGTWFRDINGNFR